MLNALLSPSGSVEERIKEMLHAIRVHLGMDIGFVSEFRDGSRFFSYVDASSPNAPIIAGDSNPLEESYCHYIVTGALPELMQDAADVPMAAAMPVTKTLPVGAHISTPIRLDDGSVYGTFCCFSYKPDVSLNERDLAILKVFADLIGNLIQVELRGKKEHIDKRRRIERIIQDRLLSVVYQPLYRISDDSLAGFEALSRFSMLPLRSPDQWFAEAAEIGLGEELEFAAAHDACTALLTLAPTLLLAINLSPQSILSPRFNVLFADLPVNRLVLEVTEHAVVENYTEIERTLAPLRQCGLRLAVDDAGAGHASFKHVLDLRPDLIKLDMSLTRDIHCDPARRALAEALTRFGRAMGSEIVAEGVEAELELEALREIGVTKAQGYLLGRPMPLKEAATLPTLLAKGKQKRLFHRS
jgi:EAL domain-containing protein (putative c-di-GMP-specific phosphodiesterase class I)